MVSGLRVDAESPRVGPSRYKLRVCIGVAPGWIRAPLHSQLPLRAAQKTLNAGQSPPQVFTRRPRRNGSEEWCRSKLTFLLPVGSSARKGPRAVAAGSLGHHVLGLSTRASLESTMGLYSGNLVLMSGYCYCCFTLLPFFFN